MQWIQTHGFALLVAAWLFSCITSVVPPLPAKCGWWATWAFNAMHVLGANLNNLVRQIPAGGQMEALVSKQIQTEADGSRTTTEIAAVSTPKP